jgi:hypothetical protein
MWKRLPLAHGYTAIVDEEDFDELIKFNWSVVRSRDGKRIYAKRTFNGKNQYLHRLLAKTPPGLVTDHINGDTLDNRKNNLRACTHSTNQHNKSVPGHSSIFRGVSWNKNSLKFEARLRAYGETYHLGYFIDEKEAARAHDLKALEIYGACAKLNFPNIRGQF